MRRRIVLFLGSLAAVVLLADLALAGSFVLGQHQARTDRLKSQLSEPYGGCDEAYRYPKSEGYAWCRDNGYLD